MTKLQNESLLSKEIFCSHRSKLFPFRVDPIEKEGRNEIGRVASLESVSIHPWINVVTIEMTVVP